LKSIKKKYKILAVVSARGGSKGVPGKNLKKLNNKPLLSYCLNTLLKIKEIDKIVLSSDSEKILKFGKKFSRQIDLSKRPKFLAQDSTPLTSVVKHVALEKLKKNYKADYVLQIAPTCPFIKKETYKKIIFYLKKGNDCVVTLKRIEHEHPYRAKKLNFKNKVFESFIKNKNVESFISRQDLPTLFCTSGGIYARSLKLLKKFNEKNFNLGKKPIGIIVDDIEAVNIDRFIDFDFAELLAKKYKIR
jgi:CMP-N,N'-diacetyllegionaminic acid synthase